jgi:hypothetical protein
LEDKVMEEIVLPPPIIMMKYNKLFHICWLWWSV